MLSWPSSLMRAVGISASIAVFSGALLRAAPAQAGDLPDLVISKARLWSTGKCGRLGPLIVGDVYVKNIGKARAQIFTTRDMVRTRVRDMPSLKDDDKFVNSMKPGEVQKIAIRMGIGRTFKISGVHTIDIVVDPENVFAEAKENNNRFSVQVTLDCR